MKRLKLGRREWLFGLAGAGSWGCGSQGVRASAAAGVSVDWAAGIEPLAPERMLDALPAPFAGWSIGYQTGRYHHHEGGRVLATTAVRVYRRGMDRVRAHWLDHVHIAEPWQFDPAFARLSRWDGAVDLEYVPEQRMGVLVANLQGRFALRMEGDLASEAELRQWFEEIRAKGLVRTGF